MSNSFNPNKHLKEQFVSNLSGSSLLEIFLVTISFPALVLIRRSVEFTRKHSGTKKKKENDIAVRNWRTYFLTLVVDFFCIIVPSILLLTVLAEWTFTNTMVLIILLFFSVTARRHKSSFLQEDGIHVLRSNISSYRVLMMLITCLSILAVDFKIFPRRYAKTETYGTSLMDLGVGSFVLANSLVSRQARGIPTMNLRHTLCSTSPLIFLGFARLIFTSGVDYQVHVGEYGVHWNFFFTLAAVAVLTSVINIPPHFCGFLGSLILIVYQVFLLLGLNKYLLSDKRGTDIISQNKEGLFSIFGYWGMYLVGVQLGSYLFFGKQGDAILRTNNWARFRVWVICLFFWFLTLFIDSHVERVSRRMCNLAYVTLILAQNLQVLAVLMLSGFIPGQKLSILEDAFDRNLLGCFLLANVLTGLVNLSVDTLFVSSIPALATLFGYAFTLSLVVGAANFYGIKLKFW